MHSLAAHVPIAASLYRKLDPDGHPGRAPTTLVNLKLREFLATILIGAIGLEPMRISAAMGGRKIAIESEIER
jgi:hypothetical protein